MPIISLELGEEDNSFKELWEKPMNFDYVPFENKWSGAYIPTQFPSCKPKPWFYVSRNGNRNSVEIVYEGQPPLYLKVDLCSLYGTAGEIPNHLLDRMFKNS